ncbi:11352_t:CDS:1, partial [Funneliformis geosporum]
MATLWIHIEGEPDSVKFHVMRQQSELDKIDLDDIRPELCNKEILKNVVPDKLKFFRYND